MKKIVTLVLSAFIFMVSAYSKELKTRKAFNLTMAVDGERYYSAEIPKSSYVLPNNTVQLFPGETLYIEADVENDFLVNLKCVSANKNPEKTLVISFFQVSEEKKHECMMLSVFNPFDRELEYSAIIGLLLYGKSVETDVWDIAAGTTGYETWPDLINTIALDNWKLK